MVLESTLFLQRFRRNSSQFATQEKKAISESICLPYFLTWWMVALLSNFVTCSPTSTSNQPIACTKFVVILVTSSILLILSLLRGVSLILHHALRRISYVNHSFFCTPNVQTDKIILFHGNLPSDRRDSHIRPYFL